MIERHFDYVLTGVTVAANATARFVVKLDTDAPFALRSLLQGQTMQNFQFVITGYDDRRYAAGASNAAVDSLLNPGTMFPLYPQITFPIGMTITIDVTDLSGLGTTGGTLVFRGTKLYPEGVVFGPSYPPKFSELNFRYPFTFSIPLGTVPNPSFMTGQPLNIKSDADFVVRMTSGFVQPGGDGVVLQTTSLILRDQYGKPFSNDYVPMQFLFPQPGVSNIISPDCLIYPEIYVARNTQLLLDIKRTDGTQNNVTNFILHGSKIFPIQ
jgi:hypothetical protein